MRYNDGVDSGAPTDLSVRQANRLRILAESAHEFAEATNNVNRLLHLAAQRFAEVIGDGCYIRMLSRDGMWLEPVATYHPDPEIERFLRETTDSVPLRFGEGISGRVVETGQSVLMPAVSFEEDLHLVEDLADRAALAIDNGRLPKDLERRVLRGQGSAWRWSRGSSRDTGDASGRRGDSTRARPSGSCCPCRVPADAARW